VNIREYVTQLYAATPGLENYDISEGTNIYDLIIEPLIGIFEEILQSEDIDVMRDMLAWDSMSDVPLETLKRYAMMIGVSVTEKQASSGILTLFFSEPIDLTIQEGTKFSYQGIEFATTEKHELTESILSAKIDGNRHYYYEGIYVVNQNGDNVISNVLGYMEGAPSQLIKITHPAIIDGIKEDTHATLIQKIRNKMLAATATGEAGMTDLIHTHYPDVDVTIIGPGDNKMERDLIYNMIPGTTKFKSEVTFNGKTRRNNVINASEAYFMVVNESDFDNAFIPDDIYEISQGRYLAITEEMDSVAIFNSGGIMTESFTQSSERIGLTSMLLSVVAAMTRYLTVEDKRLYSEGDLVNVSDRSGAQPTQNGVVEGVESVASDGEMVDATTITVDNDMTGFILPGAKLYIEYEGDTYVAYVDTITEDTITTTEEIGIDAEEEVSITSYRVTLYNNLSLEVTASGDVYVDVLNAEGLYIGEGWIKSEHGMPIGTCISDNEIMVVDNELVMGMNVTGQEFNLIKHVFLKYGINQVVHKVLSKTGIKMHWSREQQTMPIVQETQIDGR